MIGGRCAGCYTTAALAARALLGVTSSASPEAIQAAFRRLRIVHHPDKPGGSNEAYAALIAARDLLVPPPTKLEPPPVSAAPDERGDAAAYARQRGANEAEAARNIKQMMKEDAKADTAKKREKQAADKVAREAAKVATKSQASSKAAAKPAAKAAAKSAAKAAPKARSGPVPASTPPDVIDSDVDDPMEPPTETGGSSSSHADPLAEHIFRSFLTEYMCGDAEKARLVESSNKRRPELCPVCLDVLDDAYMCSFCWSEHRQAEFGANAATVKCKGCMNFYLKLTGNLCPTCAAPPPPTGYTGVRCQL